MTTPKVTEITKDVFKPVEHDPFIDDLSRAAGRTVLSSVEIVDIKSPSTEIVQELGSQALKTAA